MNTKRSMRTIGIRSNRVQFVLFLATGALIWGCGGSTSNKSTPKDKDTSSGDATSEDASTGDAVPTGPCENLETEVVTVSTQEEADALINTCELLGDLTVESSAVNTLNLPRLTKVGGTISLSENEDLTAVSLPALVTVDGGIIFHENSSLGGLELPELDFVGGDFEVTKNWQMTSFLAPKLAQVMGDLRVGGYNTQMRHFGPQNHLLSIIDLSALTHVGAALTCGGNANLELQFPALVSVSTQLAIVRHENLNAVEFPELKTVGEDFYFYKNAELSLVSAPKLEQIGALIIKEEETLESFSLPSLIRVKGPDSWSFVDSSKIEVRKSYALASFSLDSLVEVGALSFYNNTSLHSLNLRLLSKVSDWFYVKKNSQLPRCVVHGLVAQIQAAEGIGGNIAIEENKAECTCNGGECENACTPNCVNKSCGDDGCGGSCGACNDDESCNSGLCEAASNPPAPECNINVQCDAPPPSCVAPLIPVNKNGCWGCGYVETCTCSQVKSTPDCFEPEPTCSEGTEMAIQYQFSDLGKPLEKTCYACVDPITCIEP